MGEIKRIPKPNIPKPKIDLSTKTKCKGCAYHNPCTKEEDEMTYLYWLENKTPHPCHVRQNGMVCKGALESFERLGLKVENDQS